MDFIETANNTIMNIDKINLIANNQPTIKDNFNEKFDLQNYLFDRLLYKCNDDAKINKLDTRIKNIVNQ